MTDSDFRDIEIHDNLYRVLPEILAMFHSLKPFPRQKHVFKFRTGKKPEASVLFSTDRSCVGLKRGLFPALSPTTWQSRGCKDASILLRGWKGVKMRIFQQEQTRLQCQQRWEGSLSNWDDMEGERGKRNPCCNIQHKGHRNTGHAIWVGKSSPREAQGLKRPRFTLMQQQFGTAIEKLSKLRPTRLSSNSQEVSVPAVLVK